VLNVRTTVETDDLDVLIKALAHPIRRQILSWLKQPAVHFPDQ
jgi:ArsR family transcriptional regulator